MMGLVLPPRRRWWRHAHAAGAWAIVRARRRACGRSAPGVSVGCFGAIAVSTTGEKPPPRRNGKICRSFREYRPRYVKRGSGYRLRTGRQASRLSPSSRACRGVDGRSGIGAVVGAATPPDGNGRAATRIKRLRRRGAQPRPAARPRARFPDRGNQRCAGYCAHARARAAHDASSRDPP